jgi:hypothetical protein
MTRALGPEGYSRHKRKMRWRPESLRSDNARPLSGNVILPKLVFKLASVPGLALKGLGFFELFSDILQIGQRRTGPEVNHEVGRFAILIDSKVVDGG